MTIDVFESYGNIFGYAQSSPKIQSSLDRDLDPLGRDAHRGRNHLTGNLRTGCQSSKQEITRTSAGSSSPDSLVGLGMVKGASDVDRTGYGSVCLRAFCTDR